MCSSHGNQIVAKIAQPGTVRAMETWLAPFAALFTQPTWLNAVALATGGLLCLNRRTVCSALRAVDGASDKGFSRFHRFLSRGVWSGLQGSRILLGLLVKAFVPDGQALVVGVDDSIERRRGGKIRDRGISRDPVRSSRGFFVKVEGLRWLSFQVLAKPGFARRSWGLPFLTVLCPSERADAKRQRRHQTVPEQVIWGMRLIARWFPHRLLVMVGDGAFASLAVFQKLKDRAVCVAWCRMDARFFNPPPPRKKGQRGRSRVLGTRQLTPKTRAARKATKWVRMAIPGWRAEDGATDRDVDVATGTALWNSHGMTVPVRWVLTRDPAGRAETRVFVCSDPGANGIADLDVVRDALGRGGHLRGNPAPSRDRDPTPMVGSGDPSHHAAAARVVLAGDAVGLRTGGVDRQAPGPWRGMVQEPGPDVLRLPRHRPAAPVGGRGGAPDPVAG